MTSTLKMLLAVTVFTAAAWANAAVSGTDITVSDPAGSGWETQMRLVSGSSSLEFSNGTGVMGGVPTTSVRGFVGAMNTILARPTPVDGAVLTQAGGLIGRQPMRISSTLGTSINAVTVDSQTGQIQAMGGVGGLQQDANYLDGVLEGGRLTVKNLRFDLAHQVVIADLSGQALGVDDTLGPVMNSLDTPLWHITSMAGPTSLSPAALQVLSEGDFSQMAALGYTLIDSLPNAADPAHPLFTIGATHVLSGLKITPEGAQFMADSLGLGPSSVGYLLLNNINDQVDGWGSIKTNLVLANVKTIPEPGTWALMGIGLVGIAGVASRHSNMNINSRRNT